MAIMNVVEAVLVKLAVDEVNAWLPGFSQRLLNIAVLRLERDQRERFREEWAADLLAYPSGISRVCRGLGLIFAAYKMRGLGARSRRLWIAVLISYLLILQKPWIPVLSFFGSLGMFAVLKMYAHTPITYLPWILFTFAAAAIVPTFLLSVLLLGTTTGLRFADKLEDLYLKTRSKFPWAFRS